MLIMTGTPSFEELLKQRAGELARAEVASEQRALYRERWRNWAIAQKLERDINLRGNDPGDVFGRDAKPLVDGFLAFMDRAAWPNAQYLFRRPATLDPESSIFDRGRSLDMSGATYVRGYCIGVTHTFRNSYPDFEGALKIERQADGFVLPETAMVYLCEDGALRVNPTQFRSLPLNNEQRWYDQRTGLFQHEQLLKPVTPGVFGKREVQILALAPTEAKQISVEANTFAPADLGEVLTHIYLNPAGGTPTPGLTVAPKKVA